MSTALPDRFWSKVTKTETCWLWTGGQEHGYGYYFVTRLQKRKAHRVAYEAIREPIPTGLHLDHLCRVTNCVNPWHLEPVTPAENAWRGRTSPTLENAGKTACLGGHPFTSENLYVTPDGRRMCVACNRRRNQEYRARLHAKEE